MVSTEFMYGVLLGTGVTSTGFGLYLIYKGCQLIKLSKSINDCNGCNDCNCDDENKKIRMMWLNNYIFIY